MISPQIVSKIEKLIDTICQPIRIIHFNKCTGTYHIICVSKSSPKKIIDLMILVYRWVGGKHACVDLTGVSPLVGLMIEDFTVGQTILKAASSKVAKNMRECALTINMSICI
jgi:hypothetical protein